MNVQEKFALELKEEEGKNPLVPRKCPLMDSGQEFSSPDCSLFGLNN